MSLINVGYLTMRLKNKNGFTLIEVMMVVAIIGIMTAIAVPNFLTWLSNMRLNAASRDLYGAMMKAKGEAVKRNVNCGLTFNQTIGATIFAYIVFADLDRDCEYDVGEPILVQVPQWQTSVSLDTTKHGGDGLSFTDNDDSNPTIIFTPTGIPTANGGGFANGMAALRNSKGTGKDIVVNQAGSISIQ